MILLRRMPGYQNNPIYSAKQNKKSVSIRSVCVIRVPVFLWVSALAVFDIVNFQTDAPAILHYNIIFNS